MVVVVVLLLLTELFPVLEVVVLEVPVPLAVPPFTPFPGVGCRAVPGRVGVVVAPPAPLVVAP